MRLLYSLLMYLLLPAALVRLWWKGRRLASYRRHWGERFARKLPPVSSPIWLHAVSVGEVRAAQPLVRALLTRYPQKPFLITVTTPTGRETVRELFGSSVNCCYFPFDLPGTVDRFVETLNPCVLIVMEVEVWPNLFSAMAARNVPLYLVNARLSARSFRGYRRLGKLIQQTLLFVRHFVVQTEKDMRRFQDLGVNADVITVAGNLKLESGLPADFTQRSESLGRCIAGRYPVWVAASTHAGEEGEVLCAHKALLGHCPEALLILAPRHPDRAHELSGLCIDNDMSFVYYSEASSGQAIGNVLIVDRLGALIYCFGVADAAFMGGSLVRHGGHNPVEALRAGVPLVSGPYVENFSDLYEKLLAANAAFIINDHEDLLNRLMTWFASDEQREQAVAAGKNVIDDDKGVLDRVLAVLEL